MALHRPYTRIKTNLKLADKAATFLDSVVFRDLAAFPKYENYYLKPRIQDALGNAIADALEANEKRPEQYKERMDILRRARGRLRFMLILTNSAVSRGYLSPDRAGAWQEEIDGLIAMTSKLIQSAYEHRG